MKRSSELESEPGLLTNAFTKTIKVGDIVDVVPKAGPWFPDEGGRARIESISSDGIAVNYLVRRERGLISEHQFLVAVDKDDGDDDDDGGGETSPKRTTSEEPMVSPRRSSRTATVASTLSANKPISASGKPVSKNKRRIGSDNDHDDDNNNNNNNRGGGAKPSEEAAAVMATTAPATATSSHHGHDPSAEKERQHSRLITTSGRNLLTSDTMGLYSSISATAQDPRYEMASPDLNFTKNLTWHRPVAPSTTAHLIAAAPGTPNVRFSSPHSPLPPYSLVHVLPRTHSSNQQLDRGLANTATATAAATAAIARVLLKTSDPVTRTTTSASAPLQHRPVASSTTAHLITADPGTSDVRFSFPQRPLPPSMCSHVGDNVAPHCVGGGEPSVNTSRALAPAQTTANCATPQSTFAVHPRNVLPERPSNWEQMSQSAKRRWRASSSVRPGIGV